jgi:hypothetical protein
MKELTNISVQPSESEIDLSKWDSGSSYNGYLHSVPIYLKKINNANSEQIQKIIYFIERELKWLDSDAYFSRKREATKMSESMIEKDAQRIKEQLAKTEINLLNQKADLAVGVYSQDKKNPIINIFKTDNEDLTLNTIDHEIKHAVSEQALETMDDLIKVFTSNYKKYPKINNKRLIDYLIPVETLGKWASNAQEQQVISKRIMDLMETVYGIKRGNSMTTDDLKPLISDFNSQLRKGDERNGDIIGMLYKMKQKHKESYKYKLCEMVNNAY